MARKLKFGIFGVGRGSVFARTLMNNKDAELVAVCDAYVPVLEKFKANFGKGVTFYDDPDRFLEHDLDAVILANYATEHAPYAIKSLDSGRHVSSECLAFRSLAEAVALIEAVERNPQLVYAYEENYCYFRSVMEMRRLFMAGAIGELLHCEGSYVHDCSMDWPSLTFGGRKDHWRSWAPSTFYCTHSMGPIIYATGARPTRLSAYESPSVKKRGVGANSADGAVITMQLDNNAICKILPWCNWHAGSGGSSFALYGSEGYMESEGSKIHFFSEATGERFYSPVFPFDKEYAALAEKEDHGGGDFYTINLFIDTILGRERFNGQKAINVYEAVDMTMPGVLGYRSILAGNSAIEVPNLKDKAVREKFRMDTWAFGPASSPAKKLLEQIQWKGSVCEIYEEQGRCVAELRSTSKIEATVRTGLSKSEAAVSGGMQALGDGSFKLEVTPVKLEALGPKKDFIEKLKNAEVDFASVSLLKLKLLGERDGVSALAILENNTDGTLSGSLQMPELAAEGCFRLRPNGLGSFNLPIGKRGKLPSRAILKLSDKGTDVEFSVKLPAPGKIAEVGRKSGSKEWLGEERMASFEAMHDGKTLYLSIDVKDASPYGSEQFLAWEQDCVELFFDTTPDRLENIEKYDGNVGHLFIMPRLPEGSQIKVMPGELQLSEKNVSVKVVQTAEGYTAELEIPLALLRLEDSLEGRRIGFDIQVDDVVETGKRNVFYWSSRGRAFCDRSTFGALVFE